MPPSLSLSAQRRPSCHPRIEGEIGVQTDGPSQIGASEVMQGEEDESFVRGMQMMGLEDCDHNGEDECLKGRLLSEAHLDYIYTQQQNP
ncbi:putative phytosulfokines 6 [Acorus gramineus]|uniref:Phytosulfokine n=1 Tax=Acorus gramineus TaxID=55184 RepID=A0AAV9BKA9_ACOGR|nr:putative phytosulfokines 6 [Acorus gramineus]